MYRGDYVLGLQSKFYLREVLETRNAQHFYSTKLFQTFTFSNSFTKAKKMHIVEHEIWSIT